MRYLEATNLKDIRRKHISQDKKSIHGNYFEGNNFTKYVVATHIIVCALNNLRLIYPYNFKISEA